MRPPPHVMTATQSLHWLAVFATNASLMDLLEVVQVAEWFATTGTDHPTNHAYRDLYEALAKIADRRGRGEETTP